MIITLTLNPAVDKTAIITPLKAGGLNRVQSFTQDAGGKGINVSKVISMLGANSVATGFMGEENADVFKSALAKLNCKFDFIKVAGSTRTNLKLYDEVNGITEINEPGIFADEKQVERLIHENLFTYACRDAIFVLAGSMHKNADAGFYKNLTHLLKQKGSQVFLDADNEAFALALEAKPDFIKPNKEELLRYFKKESASEQELLEMCKSLTEKGIGTIVLSLGPQGAIFVSKDEAYSANAVDVEVSSTVGAGDSMVGAFAYAVVNRLSFVEAAKLAMACSAGAVTTKGTNPPTLELVNKLKEQVVLNKIY